MDPFSIVLFVGFGFSLFFLGAALGNKTTTAKLYKEIEGLRDLKKIRTELNVAQSAVNWQKEKFQLIVKELAEAKKQRDDYAKIASSHEVKWTGWPTGKYKDETRKYTLNSDIQSNLDSIKKILKETGVENLQVDLELDIWGAWKQLFVEQYGWRWGGKEKNDEINRYYVECSLTNRVRNHFQGDPITVANEIEKAIKDPTMGFFVKNNWAISDPNATIKLIMNVSYKKQVEEPVKPEIHKIEVLRIQKETEIVEVEKPILVETDTQDLALPKDLDELIAAKIEVELAEREAKRHFHKVAE